MRSRLCPLSPAGRRSRGAGGLRIIDQLACQRSRTTIGALTVGDYGPV